jgi:hypothetical protein
VILNDLRNTHLKSPYRSVSFGPNQTVPSYFPTGGAPADVPAVICFPPFRRFFKLSCNERPTGSLPAFAWDDVALRLNPCPPHYRTAFAFSSFFYLHSQQLPLRSACPYRQKYRLTVFHLSNEMG